jgi:hypothetical protein
MKMTPIEWPVIITKKGCTPPEFLLDLARRFY